MGIKNNYYIFIITFPFLLFVLSGCTAIRYSEQLLTLKAIGKSQREIQQYLDKQERLFYQLTEDIKNKRLKPGISKVKIIRTYGDPILSKAVDNDPSIKERLLYRRPMRAFTSNRIYLYFNNSGKLSYWEYMPFSGGDPES
ncbi:MAG: hypothetical protein KAS99_01930 [Candidatus Omnitrophica bacterium]|nr:hypothetical protein [Candidatus Omnitrophota bacterium]